MEGLNWGIIDITEASKEAMGGGWPGENIMPELEHTSRITWYGRLDGGHRHARVWTGRISAADLPENWESIKNGLDSYYVPVSPGSHIRCIDGRPQTGVLGLEDRSRVINRHYGPQIPGGSPAAALAFRVASFYESNGDQPVATKNSSIIDDLIRHKERSEALGLPFPAGTHVDDHSQSPFTGCGAVDQAPAILQRMGELEALPTLREYAALIAGDDYTDAVFNGAVHKLVKINEPPLRDMYLQLDEFGEYSYRQLTLEAIQKAFGPKAVERMTGEHKEVAVIVNESAQETFHRDLFCYDTGNNAQLFNYDYWFTVQQAKELFDNPMAAEAYAITQLNYAVATAMVLTDGSLEVGIRH